MADFLQTIARPSAAYEEGLRFFKVGVKTITLPKLVELKLASGITGLGRRKDLADVQELIRALDLTVAFAESLDASVQPMYLELHDELRRARESGEGIG